MDEYIKRDGLLRKFNIDDMMNVNGTLISLHDARETISNFPSADVAPVRHGAWISWDEADNFIPSPHRHECSVCHDAAQVLVNGVELLSDYCPNCGAKMDGWRVEGEEND